jgi:hypothetical protein
VTLYRIGNSTNCEFIKRLIENGTLVEAEMFTCYDCGVRSPDQAHFTRINREKPGFNYPGSDGDLACCACAQGHAEWYKER